MKTLTHEKAQRARDVARQRFGRIFSLLQGRAQYAAAVHCGIGAIFGSRGNYTLVGAVNRAGSEESGVIGAVNEIVQDGDWMHISPFGEFKNPVGLQVCDRQAFDGMVAEFKSIAARMANRFRGAPLFVGHPDADDPEDRDLDPRYGKAAVGWWKELQVRGDGLWGKPKKSAAANEIIDNGYYMYLSPYWGMKAIPGRKGAFRPAVLFSVGFTNNPNIPGLPVGRNTKQKEETTMPEWLIKLLTSAGVLKPAANEATEEEVKTAVNGLLALPAKLKKATEDLTAANSEKTRLDGELKAANTAKTKAEGTAATNEENFKKERKARIDEVLTHAVNEGRIKVADRPEWAGKLTSDFDGELKNIQALKKAVNTESKAKNLGGRRGEVAVGDGQVAALNSAAAKYAKENGLDAAKDRVQIFNALRREQPKLFEEEKSVA